MRAEMISCRRPRPRRAASRASASWRSRPRRAASPSDPLRLGRGGLDLEAAVRRAQAHRHAHELVIWSGMRQPPPCRPSASACTSARADAHLDERRHGDAHGARDVLDQLADLGARRNRPRRRKRSWSAPAPRRRQSGAKRSPPPACGAPAPDGSSCSSGHGAGGAAALRRGAAAAADAAVTRDHAERGRRRTVGRAWPGGGGGGDDGGGAHSAVRVREPGARVGRRKGPEAGIGGGADGRGFIDAASSYGEDATGPRPRDRRPAPTPVRDRKPLRFVAPARLVARSQIGRMRGLGGRCSGAAGSWARSDPNVVGASRLALPRRLRQGAPRAPSRRSSVAGAPPAGPRLPRSRAPARIAAASGACGRLGSRAAGLPLQRADRLLEGHAQRLQHAGRRALAVADDGRQHDGAVDLRGATAAAAAAAACSMRRSSGSGDGSTSGLPACPPAAARDARHSVPQTAPD